MELVRPGAAGHREQDMRCGMKGYTVIFKAVPDQPEVLKFVSRSRRMIVINTAARKDAKIIKLME